MHIYLNTPRRFPRMFDIGEGKGQAMRAALGHPFGLTLLVLSLLLAVAIRFLPISGRLSDFAPWFLLWGIAAYIATVVAVSRLRPTPSEPELKELDSIRRFMEAKLAERKAASESSEFTRILSDAIVHLDRQLTPALESLINQYKESSNDLARFENGELPQPEPTHLERLRQRNARQQAAIEETVQQASNAAATLVTLLQEGDETNIAIHATTWARDLSDLSDVINDVISNLINEEGGENSPGSTSNKLTNKERESSPEVSENFRSLVEEALRQLHNVNSLSKCDIADLLPNTLLDLLPASNNGLSPTPTRLEQAQALREAIEDSIEVMNPGDEHGRAISLKGLHYHILHEQYVLRRPTRQIMMHYSLPESTYHRYRRDAVTGLANHLQQQEEQLGHYRIRLDNPPLAL